MDDEQRNVSEEKSQKETVKTKKEEKTESKKALSAKKDVKDVKEKSKKGSKAWVWVVQVLFLTLILSFVFSLSSEIVMNRANLIIAYALIFVIIFISIIFDMIGTAAAACDIQPFLAMSARKVKGSKQAVSLVKNADKVSSVCADIIGDICGVVSGACGGAIVARQFIAQSDTLIISVIFSAVIAALTVSGKAMGKSYAINNSTKVVFTVAKVLSIFKRNS